MRREEKDRPEENDRREEKDRPEESVKQEAVIGWKAGGEPEEKSGDVRDEAHKYDDIINLPHHVSTRHPRMSPLDRAAQFSPFAALTGHDAAIRETARLAESRF